MRSSAVKRGQARGFSLIELLIVMVIIAILVLIAIPAISNYRNNARVAAVQSDVRNAATALESSYLTTGAYPATGALPSSISRPSAGVTLTVAVSSGDQVCVNGVHASATNSNYYYASYDGAGSASGVTVERGVHSGSCGVGTTSGGTLSAGGAAIPGGGTTTAPTQTYTNAILASNPVAFYRLDSATSYADVSTAARSGATVEGTRTVAASRNGGTAINTTNGSVTIPLGSAVVSTRTVEFWMYTNSAADATMPVGFNLYDLAFVNGSFGFNSGAGDVYGVAPSVASGLVGRWVHVVATFQDANATGSTLWIDGVQQILTARAAVHNNSYARITTSLSIGRWGAGTTTRFQGLVDDVSVYDRALTQSEITAHFTATGA